jgi:hypothetical protein
MAKGHIITCTIKEKIILFFKIGFYTFYMPFLESKYGLREFFSVLSHNKKVQSCDKLIIRNYIHTWLSIKGLFKPEHCWNRTLLLYKFLMSAGYNVIIYTGIRKDTVNTNQIIGHSWVTIDGKVFDDKKDVADEYYITFHYP